MSFSLDFKIGAVAAIAAAPHTPVPIPSSIEISLFPLIIWFKSKVKLIEKIITIISISSNFQPLPRISPIFNFNPYKIIANFNKRFDANVIPGRICSG